MARKKEIRYMTVEMREGFDGTSAVNDTLVATDTTMGVDTHVLADSRTVVPVGALFTTAGITTTRTVTATQNSQQWTLDLSASSGGTFSITLNGSTDASVAYNVVAATFQTALEALVGAGNVTVTEAAGVYTITFAGTLANIATNTLTVDGASLTAADSEVLTAVQDGTTTWEVTFTPAIATGSVPADDAVVTWYPRRISAKLGSEGEVSHTKTKDPIIDTDRGVIDGARLGIDQPLTVDLTYVYDWLRASSGNAVTVDEVLEQEGEAADWITSAVDPCEPYQVDIFVIDRPPCGSEEAEITIYRYFIYRTVNASVTAASVTVNGVCVSNKPEVVRLTNDDDTIAQYR